MHRYLTARSWLPRAAWRGIALGAVGALASVALAACGSSPPAQGTRSVVSAPVRVARTRLGRVGYRVVGSGPPLIMIMGYGWTMDDWDPRLIHALAQHHRVVMFDNSGVGRTQQVPAPSTIDAMANQASALITTLGLRRPDVLGWSMGGAIAQALAVLHPAQVRRLVLAATFPGSGQDVAPPVADQASASDFPANQAQAQDAFKAAVDEFSGPHTAPAGTKGIQGLAMSNWNTGLDAAGRKTPKISAPTLIADGTQDELDPVANDHTLAHLIRGSRLTLYPDAGHAFLFQDWARFAASVDSFLASPARS
jgi:pimeloyl-ACP methyl ester carboxylesterase